MLGGDFVLTQSPVLSSSKQEHWNETEKSRKPWQNGAACILTPWQLQTELSFLYCKAYGNDFYSVFNVLFQTVCQSFSQLVFQSMLSQRNSNSSS